MHAVRDCNLQADEWPTQSNPRPIDMPILPLETRTVLLAIVYLLVKHFIADFLLQTERQRREKGIYGAPGGLTHALTHIAFTMPVFWLLHSSDQHTIALLLAAEFTIHYHLDWAKEQIVRTNGWGAQNRYFWWALGADQMCHALTYIAIVWLAL